MPENHYFKQIHEWQNQMDKDLRAEDGWLSLAGLHWLQPGENKTGSNPAHPVPLPAEAPDTVGTLTLDDQTDVTFEPAPDVLVEIDGQPVTGKVKLEPDITHNPSVVQLNGISFFIIIRGDRTGVRVKHINSPVRLNFPGREWWPVDENLRVTARIHPYEPPKMVSIPNILGDIDETAMHAALEFDLHGETHTLDAMRLPSGAFRINFHDESCGQGSYPPGRFLVTEIAAGDTVVIDFNKAYNPPCAFTNFATCPLPPKQNYLPVPIQAGERYIQLPGHH